MLWCAYLHVSYIFICVFGARACASARVWFSFAVANYVNERRSLFVNIDELKILGLPSVG